MSQRWHFLEFQTDLGDENLDFFNFVFWDCMVLSESFQMVYGPNFLIGFGWGFDQISAWLGPLVNPAACTHPRLYQWGWWEL
jgi:hypothetical protein